MGVPVSLEIMIGEGSEDETGRTPRTRQHVVSAVNMADLLQAVLDHKAYLRRHLMIGC